MFRNLHACGFFIIPYFSGLVNYFFEKNLPAGLPPPAAFSGVPEVIRTPDLPLRRRSLYPAELRKHITIVIISQFCNFVKCLFDKKSWLAIATSIDALAVGITFAFLNIFLEGVGILK